MTDDHRNPFAHLDDSAEPLPPPRVRSGNAMGVAGFVTSLVAPCTGFLLSPLAVLLSLIGLRRPPRGLAIAGTVIGMLGSLLLVTAIVILVSPLGQTMFSVGHGVVAIVDYYSDHQTLPDEQQGNDLVGQYEDGYGTPLRYEPVDDHQFIIISAGPDQQFGSDTDRRYPIDLRDHVTTDRQPGQAIGPPADTQSPQAPEPSEATDAPEAPAAPVAPTD